MDRRLLLGASFLLCAVGVFGLLRSLTSGAEEIPVVYEAQPEETENSINVWTVGRTLEKGDEIHRQDLQPAVISSEMAQQYGINRDNRFTLPSGSLAGTPLTEGSVVTQKQLVAPGDSGYFQLLLGEDMLAHTLDVSRSDFVAGNITVGDRVDIVLIASPDYNLAANERSGSHRSLSLSPIIRARRVLDMSSKGDSLVIGLTPNEVSRVMLARRAGILKVLESKSAPLPGMHVNDVLPGFHSVRELRGGNRTLN